MVAIVGVVVILGLGQYIIELLQPIFHYSTSVIDTFQALKWPLTTVVLLVIMCLIYAVVLIGNYRYVLFCQGLFFRQSVGCYYHKFWFVRKIF